MISFNVSLLLLLLILEVIFVKIFLIHLIFMGRKLPETKLGSIKSMISLSMLNLTLKSSFNSFRIILSSILMIVQEKFSQLLFSLRKHFKVVLEQWTSKTLLILKWTALFQSPLSEDYQSSLWKMIMKKI